MRVRARENVPVNAFPIAPSLSNMPGALEPPDEAPEEPELELDDGPLPSRKFDVPFVFVSFRFRASSA